ncbi:hypothetical protein [Tenacibaculum sp. M341]|uniref:hypothetical protein n=1 Tax=Tenacibaculum sp. M341 TaxID=2530339 RepID=UPI00104FADB1|nr:hypothetical protein [Tenacibaculum sp. M341]TCI93627.1 hypothetical protein EYW44_04235 [Tenacibaculum sp. M341]
MNKEQKTNTWKLLFIISPAILFGNIAEILDDKNIAFTVGLTIIGVSLGFLAHYLTKKKTLSIKIIALSILIIIPLSIIVFNVENELEKKWSNQIINTIEFSSPTVLKLINSDIPENLKEYYNKLEIYNDGKKDKSIILYTIELKDENIDLKNYFEQYLETFKVKIPNIKTVDIIEQIESENDILTKFKFSTKNETLNGYSRFIKKDRNLNMFWLVPFSKSYTEKYIEKFNKNILTQKL